MRNDERDLAAPTTDAAVAPETAVGDIDLGKVPALGRRARLLAGMTTAAAAVAVVAFADTGTSHSISVTVV
jgi:hypothetical protein